MNNSSLEFLPFNWLSLVSGLNRRFALKYITVKRNFKGTLHYDTGFINKRACYVTLPSVKTGRQVSPP